MLTPRITILEALLVVLIGVYSLWLAVVIYRARSKSNFPNAHASLVLAGIALWLFVAAFDDRVSDRGLNLFFSRLGYELPLIILYIFALFALKFPKKTKKKVFRAIIVPLTTITLIVSYLIFHPADLLIYSHETLGADVKPGWPFFLTIGTYLAPLSVGAMALINKSKHSSPRNRNAIKIILLGFSLTTITAIGVAILMSLTGSTPYLYQYAYYSTLFFAVALSYSIIRHSALKTVVTFKRGSLVAIALVLLATGYTTLSGIDRLLDISPIQLAIWTSLLSITSILGTNLFLDIRNEFRSLTYNSSNASYQDQLQNIRKQYGITWCVWKSRTGSIIAGKLPESFEISQSTNQSSASSRVDVAHRTAQKLGLRFLDDVSPTRVALVFKTAYGTFISGRRAFNLIFSEEDLKKLKHDVNLFATTREIQTLKKEALQQAGAIKRDTTDRQEKLITINQQLRDKLRKRARFFKSVATTVRTPLTVLANTVQDKSTQVAPPVVRSITTNTKRLLDLTHELQQEPDAQTIGKEPPIDLMRLVQDAERKHAAASQRKNISLTVTAAGNAPVEGIRRLHLDEIIDNLVGNAIKYSRAGALVSLQCTSRAGKLTIRVTDTGPGVPPEDRDLIFEPFYRASAHEHLPGTGLGLSGVRDLAKTYHGDVNYQTNSPHGSIFTVTLGKKGAT